MVKCPSKFEAEIEGDESLETLIHETITKIIIDNPPQSLDTWPAFNHNDTGLPGKKSMQMDEEKGIAAFFLKCELPDPRENDIKEGIYGIRKIEKILRGRLIKLSNYDFFISSGLGYIEMGGNLRYFCTETSHFDLTTI
jgi:hypothetical protein